MKWYVVLIFPLIILNAKAQTSSGYRGKRFSLTYQPGISLLDYIDIRRPVFHHKADLGFVLNKHSQIFCEFSYSHYKTNNMSFYITELTDVLYGVRYQYFRKNKQAYAPNGQYFGIGIDYGKQNTFSKNENNESKYNSNIRVNCFLFSIYAGRNFLLKERFLFGYGIQYGVGTGSYQPIRHIGKVYLNMGIIM